MSATDDLQNLIPPNRAATRNPPSPGYASASADFWIKGALVGLFGAFLMGTAAGIDKGLLNGIAFGLAAFLTVFRIFGMVGGTLVGFAGAGIFGMLAVAQHIAPRFLLWLDGSTPSGDARLLDYYVDRIFLRRVGGGYIFIRRYQMEYFASLTEEDNKRLSAIIPLSHAISTAKVRSLLGSFADLILANKPMLVEQEPALRSRNAGYRWDHPKG